MPLEEHKWMQGTMSSKKRTTLENCLIEFAPGLSCPGFWGSHWLLQYSQPGKREPGSFQPWELSTWRGESPFVWHSQAQVLAVPADQGQSESIIHPCHSSDILRTILLAVEIDIIWDKLISHTSQDCLSKIKQNFVGSVAHAKLQAPIKGNWAPCAHTKYV